MPVLLQDVVKVNPVSYAVDGVRQLLIGATGMTSLLIDFAVVIGFATVLSTIGIVLSWRFLSK
jgi:ABC-2 type transport system permease protein